MRTSFALGVGVGTSWIWTPDAVTTTAFINLIPLRCVLRLLLRSTKPLTRPGLLSPLLIYMQDGLVQHNGHALRSAYFCLRQQRRYL